MYLDHIAIWTDDLEKLKEFYSGYFNCTVSARYDNPQKQFSSYFLTFPSGAGIEIMKRSDITESDRRETLGLAHIAICVGSEEDVDAITHKLRDAGVKIRSNPRRTGDGFYESVVLDPDDNLIELTARRATKHS